MPHRLQHALHLMFPPLMNRDLQPGVLFSLSDFFHPRRAGDAILHLHAAFQGFDLVVRQHPLHFDQVRFGDMVPGMDQRLRQIAVVGQQHQPFAVRIQSADRKHADAHAMKQILHRRPAFGIAQRRHDSLRFIQHDIGMRLDRLQMTAIDLDVIPSWIHAGSKFPYDLPVHGHPSLRDHRLRLPSRRQPRTCNHLLKPY